MDKMIEAGVGIAVFFVLVSTVILTNYQDARDAASSEDTRVLLYLVLFLFLVAIAMGTYKKVK
jgi:hypothetical protein